VSNYTGGTVAVYHTLPNGSLSESFQVLDHNNTDAISHAHSANFYNNNLFVADLGRDFLTQYVQNNDNSENYVLKEHHFMKDNAGPRHFEISSDGASIYVINELNSTITVLKKEGHKYLNIQNISTLSDVYSGKNSCADIHLSKNEKYLYGSNRGENSIVVFKRDKSTDLLQKIQTISTHGDWPRNFTLAPNGKFLLVANQKSNTISVYNINEKTGTLTFSGSVAIPAPVCLLF
jgi:6-phosphogluconolactonase